MTEQSWRLGRYVTHPTQRKSKASAEEQRIYSKLEVEYDLPSYRVFLKYHSILWIKERKIQLWGESIIIQNDLVKLKSYTSSTFLGKEAHQNILKLAAYVNDTQKPDRAA